MKTKIEKWILNLFNKALHENQGMIAYNLQKEIAHVMFAHIGIDKLKEMINDIEKNKPAEKYVSLAEMFIERQRDYLSSHVNEINHNYFKLLEPIGELLRNLKK